MLVEQRKDNQLYITINEKEYLTIYSPDKRIRLVIEYRNGQINVKHFNTKE